MKPKSFNGMACSIAGALELLGDQWKLLIVRDLFLGLARHDELLRSTGAPPTTLSSRLRQLEQSGIVEKIPYQNNPPRSEYGLTAKGRTIWPVLQALAQWGDQHDASGRGAPPVEFVDRETGRPVRLALVDAETGRPVAPHQVEPLPGPGADEMVHWRLQKGAARRNR